MSATEYAKNLPIRSNVTTGMERILNVPRVSVYNTAGLAAWANNTVKAVTWDTLDYQTEGNWSTASGTAIIIKTAGTYEFKGWMMWASNATGYRQLYLRKNGNSSNIIYADSVVQAVNGTVTSQSTSAQVPMSAEDYMELVGVQGSGGNLGFTVATATVRENGFQACLIST